MHKLKVSRTGFALTDSYHPVHLDTYSTLHLICLRHHRGMSRGQIQRCLFRCSLSQLVCTNSLIKAYLIRWLCVCFFPAEIFLFVLPWDVWVLLRQRKLCQYEISRRYGYMCLKQYGHISFCIHIWWYVYHLPLLKYYPSQRSHCRIPMMLLQYEVDNLKVDHWILLTALSSFLLWTTV